MPFVFKRLALVMSITAAFAADKEPFKAGPIASYPHKQTNAEITIAADPFASGEKVKTAFGKLDPSQYGLLPVLVVIQNDSKETIRVDRMKLTYIGGTARVEATPAADVKYTVGPQRPNVYGGPAGRVAIR